MSIVQGCVGFTKDLSDMTCPATHLFQLRVPLKKMNDLERLFAIDDLNISLDLSFAYSKLILLVHSL